MITVENGTSVVIASNDKTITVSGNGNSTTTTVSAEPVILENGGTSSPVVIGEVLPKIRGIVVVSSGASSTQVRLNILSAVQTLFELSSDDIQILVGD